MHHLQQEQQQTDIESVCHNCFSCRHRQNASHGASDFLHLLDTKISINALYHDSETTAPCSRIQVELCCSGSNSGFPGSGVAQMSAAAGLQRHQHCTDAFLNVPRVLNAGIKQAALSSGVLLCCTMGTTVADCCQASRAATVQHRCSTKGTTVQQGVWHPRNRPTLHLRVSTNTTAVPPLPNLLFFVQQHATCQGWSHILVTSSAEGSIPPSCMP